MAIVTPDSSNTLFQLAIDLVNQSSRNIFLTGKAGTGKTTFLKYIRENCPKQMAVVAPTGVAAINAGGVTIHSLFQLPLSPFIPDGGVGVTAPFSIQNGRELEPLNRHGLLSRMRMNTEKKKVLEELELLIIDEISMVRCDTLDAVDAVLRHVRNRHGELFGGVQVVFIGDMFQLPPVIKEQEWAFLADYYKSPYFFDSLAIKEEQPLYIEFDKIYRQNDERFIFLLNQVRNNELDEDGLAILESRFQPAFRRTRDDGYIILTTHNEIARDTNTNRLNELGGKVHSFRANVEDEFPANAYPGEEVLYLKTGAQVMFIKNDSDKAKRYFNGKIGTVMRIEEEKIFVQCKDEPVEIEVSRDKWENIRYSVNGSTRMMEQKLLGTFSQFPLRLAWAITIHKSQGLTFEKAIIDAGKSFASGQVYVALSRCTSLEGLVLQSRINQGSLQIDQRIVRFSKNIVSSDQLKEELIRSRKHYEVKTILSLFDFRKAVTDFNEVGKYLKENSSSFNAELLPWFEALNLQLITQQETGSRFQLQLQGIYNREDTVSAGERIRAASEHFTRELAGIIKTVHQSPAQTDARTHAREFNDMLKDVYTELCYRKHMIEGLTGHIGLEDFYKRKRLFKVPTFTLNAYAGVSQKPVAVPHPLLHQLLRKQRDSICERKGVPLYLVAGTQTLAEMATYLPQTLDELLHISGFGPARVGAYGQQFLDIIVNYSIENGLSSGVATKAPKAKQKQPKKVKTNTREETYSLFKQGLTVGEISKERKLTIQTVENHLAFYVGQGIINIGEVVTREKLLLIEPLVKESNGGAITPIKEQLGDSVGFGDIRLVMAWSSFQKQQGEEGVL